MKFEKATWNPKVYTPTVIQDPQTGDIRESLRDFAVALGYDNREDYLASLGDNPAEVRARLRKLRVPAKPRRPKAAR